MAAVSSGFLGDYHRSSANLTGDVTEITFQESKKLPTVNSPASPPRVQGNKQQKSCKHFLILAQFSFISSSRVGCVLPVASYILPFFILLGAF